MSLTINPMETCEHGGNAATCAKHNDEGHNKLIADLTDLLLEAKQYHFHDFKGNEYGGPKNVLAERFRVLRNNVIKGIYDN